MVNRAWTSANGEWGTASDWTPNGVPTNTDAASLTNGSTIDVAPNDFSAVAETLSVTSGTISVQGGLSVDGLTVANGGFVNVVGGSLQTGYQRQGGTVYNQTGNVSVSASGNLTVGNYIAGVVSGNIMLQTGGSYYYQDAIASSSANNSVEFSSNGGGLFSDSVAWGGTIEGFNTSNQNSLSFNGQIKSFSYSTVNKTLTVTTTSNTFTERFADNGLTQSNFTDAGNAYIINYAGQTVCFRSGTLIATPQGDKFVECLRVGDLVTNSDGQSQSIRWLGRRTMKIQRHLFKQEVYPIRISAHAFDENRPARDLFVSPGHAICVDLLGEVLIPAGVLVNGSTIQQVEVDEVTYWHVELDSHDIILAEGLACESYLEMGNRGFFAENAVVDFDPTPDAPVPTHADFCRPFYMKGAFVEVIRKQLAARARHLGWRLETPGMGDVHLLVDGVRVDPRMRDLELRFLVPAGAKTVWLVSGTACPQDVGDSLDTRELGLCIARLVVDQGFSAPHAIEADDERLCVGFYPAEGSWRWTAGRALLPAQLWAGIGDAFFLRAELHCLPLPRWIEPVAACAEVTSFPLTLVA